jgi:Rod binding domain-containing protein
MPGSVQSFPQIPSSVTQAALPPHQSPARIHDAAQQFESLLLGQILESVSNGGGWLGSGEDSSSGCANGFAQQQLATMIARHGGLGLAQLIEKGLKPA